MLELREVAIVQTGVPITEIASGSARFVRLSDLSELRAGRTPSLGAGDLPAVARALTIEQGDVVVGARGTTTEVCLATEALLGAFISLDLYLVRPNPAIVNSQFLAAFLTLPSTQALLAGSKQGSGLARLPKDALEQTRIPLPPMQVQGLIAELVVSFEEEDRLLKKLTQLNSLLGRETIARAFRAAETQSFSPRSY